MIQDPKTWMESKGISEHGDLDFNLVCEFMTIYAEKVGIDFFMWLKDNLKDMDAPITVKQVYDKYRSDNK